MTRRRFPAKALFERLIEFNGRCAECGCRVGGTAGLHWDHVIPLALGGEDTLENLQPLCKACHRAKTAEDVGRIAKAKRMNQREAGIKRQAKAIIPGSKASGWKKKVNGRAERR